MSRWFTMSTAKNSVMLLMRKGLFMADLRMTWTFSNSVDVANGAFTQAQTNSLCYKDAYLF